MNNGDWATVEAGTEVPFGADNGDLRLRGTNPKGTADNINDNSTITFTNDVDVACTGDIRTLLDWRNYNTVDTQNARFCYLFKGCSVLTSAPELPATTLADFCYQGMFFSCTSLKSAPKLPATTLTEACYAYMFAYCTSLTSAPLLPATTLAGNCYEGMFCGCTKLSTVTMLAPSNQITSWANCVAAWLENAGTDGIETPRTLNVKDEAAYTALESKKYLPDNWKKGTAGTTVKKEDNTEIK